MKLISGGWRTLCRFLHYPSYLATLFRLPRYSIPVYMPDSRGPYCERRAPVCPKVIYPEAEAFPTTFQYFIRCSSANFYSRIRSIQIQKPTLWKLNAVVDVARLHGCACAKVTPPAASKTTSPLLYVFNVRSDEPNTSPAWI